jgi:hypothetical protein
MSSEMSSDMSSEMNSEMIVEMSKVNNVMNSCQWLDYPDGQRDEQ